MVREYGESGKLATATRSPPVGLADWLLHSGPILATWVTREHARGAQTGGMAELAGTHRTGYALELVDLRREFSEKVAVDDANLRVPHGSFYGLVGPNGAGKTTALSMAVGLLRPSGGHAFVEGVDVWEDPVAAKRHLGVLPDGLALPERLTGGELLTYWGRFRGLDAAAVASRSAELIRILELEEAETLGTLVGEYSTGMRKKNRPGDRAAARALRAGARRAV